MGVLALIAVLLSAGPRPAESSLTLDAATAAFAADVDFLVLTPGAELGLHVQDAAVGDALFIDLVRVGPMGAPGPLTLRVSFGPDGSAEVRALLVKTPVRIERKLPASAAGGGDLYASNPARHRLALPPGNTALVLVADGDGAVRIRIGRSAARARPAHVAAAALAEPTAPVAASAPALPALDPPSAIVAAVPVATAPSPRDPAGPTDAGAGATPASPGDAAPADATAPPVSAPEPAAPVTAASPALVPPSPPAADTAAAAGPAGDRPAGDAAAPLSPQPEAAPAAGVAVVGDVRIGVRGLWSGLQPFAPMGAARVLIGSRTVAAGLALDFDLSHADVQAPQASWDAATTQLRVEARVQSPTPVQLGTFSLTPALVVGLGARAVAHAVVTALPSARTLQVWQLGATGRMEAEVATRLGPGDVVVSLPVDVAADPFGPVAGFVPLAAGILVGYRLAP